MNEIKRSAARRSKSLNLTFIAVRPFKMDEILVPGGAGSGFAGKTEDRSDPYLNGRASEDRMAEPIDRHFVRRISRKFSF